MWKELMATRAGTGVSCPSLDKCFCHVFVFNTSIPYSVIWRTGMSVDSWTVSTRKYFANQILYLILVLKNIGLRIRFKKKKRPIQVAYESHFPRLLDRHIIGNFYFSTFSFRTKYVCVSTIQLDVTFTWPWQIHRQGLSDCVKAYHLLTCRCWHGHLTGR